jgi:hypothetical protein
MQPLEKSFISADEVALIEKAVEMEQSDNLVKRCYGRGMKGVMVPALRWVHDEYERGTDGSDFMTALVGVLASLLITHVRNHPQPISDMLFKVMMEQFIDSCKEAMRHERG